MSPDPLAIIRPDSVRVAAQWVRALTFPRISKLETAGTGLIGSGTADVEATTSDATSPAKTR
jgi:hypothetical protein